MNQISHQNTQSMLKRIQSGLWIQNLFETKTRPQKNLDYYKMERIKITFGQELAIILQVHNDLAKQKQEIIIK